MNPECITPESTTPQDATVLIADNNTGRRHALAEAYLKSDNVGRIIVLGESDFLTHPTKPIICYKTLLATDVNEIVKICQEEQKHHTVLVDVDQDDAVEAGLTNALEEANKKEGTNIAVVGPTREAGQIEWDKNWSRGLMERARVLQPAFKAFTNVDDGKKFVEEFFAQNPGKRLFIKAAGLAAGKGAIPGEDKAAALQAIDDIKERYDSDYIVEEWIEGDDGQPGEEFSAFAYCDGENWQLVGYAQDHKRALDGDKGENTGGMGCVSNPLIVDQVVDAQAKANFENIFAQLKKEKRPYKGILYFGGMVVNRNNQPTVYAVECNARWGDPEAQVIVPSITNDFFELNLAVAQGRLSSLKIQTDELVRVSIAAAAKGYPGTVLKDTEIIGLDDDEGDDTIIFGAGIRRENNKWIANGGRLFHVVGKGTDVLEARIKAYARMRRIQFVGTYRSDIGYRDVDRLQKREPVSMD